MVLSTIKRSHVSTYLASASFEKVRHLKVDLSSSLVIQAASLSKLQAFVEVWKLKIKIVRHHPGFEIENIYKNKFNIKSSLPSET